MKVYKTVGVVISMIACCLSAFAATECVWIGGPSGDINTSGNWSTGTVPSSQTTAYIAVFTNSANLTLNVPYWWYPAGIVVSNNAEVVLRPATSDYRCRPSEKTENAEFSLTVEAGSSLKFDGVYFYSTSTSDCSLIKKGGGEFHPTLWFGHSTAKWKNVDIREGTIKFSSAVSNTCISSSLFIRSGATAVLSRYYNYSFATSPRVEIEAGGVFDVNKNYETISSLSGAGTVSNCCNILTMTLKDSGETFSGEILGGGALKITPDSGTAPDAEWIVGSATALKGVSLMRNTSEGLDYEVKFLPGISTYYAKTVPSDIPSFDTNGVPVEIARWGNFWYVDCNRAGGKGDGKSLETAFQTLAEASTNSLLSEGDTVWVAPGVYSNGTVSATQAEVVTYARASVKKNVRFVSLEGPEKTVITGASSPEPYVNAYGCGTGAVRCVMLGAGSTLRGFTLRDGRVCAKTDSPESHPYLGGGIFADESSLVIGCVVSNCVALRGGGAYYGRYFNCRFSGNRAFGVNLGAHIYRSTGLYNSVFSGGLGSVGFYAPSMSSTVLNCTFGHNSNGSLRGGADNARISLWNCLDLSGPYNDLRAEFYRSIVSTNGSLSYVTFDDACTVTRLSDSTTPTIYEFAGVDDTTLKPRKWTSRVVGAADTETYLELFPAAQYWLSVYDADFKQRIHNGKLDVGAFSYPRDVPYPSLKISIR